MRSRLRFIGFTAAARAGRFLVPSAGSLVTSPSLRFVLPPRIQLSSRPLLFRAPTPPILGPHVPEGTFEPTCLGSSPSSRHHVPASTFLRDFPIPAYVPSSGFRSLSTVFSARTLAGLFHPAATSRAVLFRAFSSRAAIPPHRRERAPLPLFPARSSPKRCPRAEPSTSRP
jgi:hypothetical protein